MRILRKPHPITMFSVWFLTVFLVLFPKGGVKFGILPITWGYLFFAFTTPIFLLVRVLALPLRFRPSLFVAMLTLLPVQVLVVYEVYFYGIYDAPFAVSTIAAFFFLPWIFLLVYAPFLHLVDGERFARYFRLSILFAALWGILLFFWHPITGHFIEIPYLTVNAEDAGELENTKHIARGLYLKLISTYNNGNLYGVCMLMLLPIHTVLEKKRWRRVILKLAMLLTLSRTVWAGLIFTELLGLTVPLAHQIRTFPRLFLGAASKRIAVLAVTIALIFTALLFNSNGLAFLFDAQFGGRDSMLRDFFNASFLPAHGLSGYEEVVYAGVTKELGYSGLMAFILLMLGPLLVLLADISALQSPMRRAALKGLLLYAVLAGIDGAFNFIPTMAFYWFVYMIFLFGWPKSATGAGVPSEAAPANIAHTLPATKSPAQPSLA